MAIQPATTKAPIVRSGTSDTTDDIVETAKTCPSCDYSGDSQFLTCPSCGIIIKKYYALKPQRANASPTPSEADAVGETSRSPKKAFLVVCSLMIGLGGAMFYWANTHPSLPGPGKEMSSPSAPAAPSNLVPSSPSTHPPSTNPPIEAVSAAPTTSENAVANTLGITIKKVIFASDVDASSMPVNDLTRVPFNGKKIVVNMKMEIPPEKTYQFTGKFYDADGKLVMNVTSPSSPTLSVWYAWYYHNFDRADDKPGLWRFVFLVNGEKVLEKPIEVVDL